MCRKSGKASLHIMQRIERIVRFSNLQLSMFLAIPRSPKKGYPKLKSKGAEAISACDLAHLGGDDKDKPIRILQSCQGGFGAAMSRTRNYGNH
jgi:hypothetical protein